MGIDLQYNEKVVIVYDAIRYVVASEILPHRWLCAGSVQISLNAIGVVDKKIRFINVGTDLVCNLYLAIDELSHSRETYFI